MKFIIIDFQKDFTQFGGAAYRDRPSVEVVKQKYIEKIKEKNHQLFSIISDYRLPRPGDEHELCVPGTEGYKEDHDGIVKSRWLKARNSPTWSRNNIGTSKPTDIPHADPDGFSRWCIWCFNKTEPIGLIGLTLDCCVLCTAMELSFRGFNPVVCLDGTDAFSGTAEDKAAAVKVIANWAVVIDSLDDFI